VNLLELFDRSLLGRSDTEALDFGDLTLTFGEIETRSNRLAQLLLQLGLKTGDHLCAILPNLPQVIDLFIACMKLGIVYVPINTMYKEREVRQILNDAEPAGVFSATSMNAEVPVWPPFLLSAPEQFADERPPVVVNSDTPAAIVYTSGTTGRSKGAILTHNNLAANALTLLDAWRITDADRFLLALPLFHVHGLGNGLHCWLASGCRMSLLPRFEHQTAAKTFLDFRPTLFFGVPTMYTRMLDIDEAQAREIGAAMRLFVSGSAPLSASVLERFRERFNHTILERYGMTETLMNISNPYDGERRPGSVGVPLPGVSVKLADDGEVLIKGANVFAGYWQREEETRAAFDEDGWFRTGDLAQRSEDGYYTLLARKSDVIISGGFNIYPREIEDFLQEQPEVAEAAVVGVPDEVRGEVPAAYVVLNTEIDTAVLEERCRAALASFKAPRWFMVVKEMPRNAMGKIQKQLLPPL